ncbi:unnamed protein product [Durusdinium trenchii]|uniref:Uncharacterized protein n=2 Tax=Durusdinium trenchii TaxID=1381693 RepID=A0ABP0QRD3_9DINO
MPLLLALLCGLTFLVGAAPDLAGEEEWNKCNGPKKPLILDHDGNYDDILVLLALLKSQHVDLQAVLITPADCELDPAVEVTGRVLAMLNRTVPVVPGQFPERYNPFPKVWRELASEMQQVADIYLQESEIHRPSEAAHEWLESYLGNASEKTDFLLTGPATNLNWALRQRPHLASKVGRVFWMAGAVEVDGNVRDSDEPGKVQWSDGSAEWNAYWDPLATRELLELNLDLWLVPLDATNAVPVHKDFIQRLNPRHQVPRVAQQIWAQSKFQKSNAIYYMWDTLTAGLYLKPSLATWRSMHLEGHTEGRRQGRIARAHRGAARGTVRVASETDVPAFTEFLLSIFNEAKPGEL